MSNLIVNSVDGNITSPFGYLESNPRLSRDRKLRFKAERTCMAGNMGQIGWDIKISLGSVGGNKRTKT